MKRRKRSRSPRRGKNPFRRRSNDWPDTSHKEQELGRISSDTDQSRLNKDNREQELNSLLEREVQIGADLTRYEEELKRRMNRSWPRVVSWTPARMNSTSPRASSRTSRVIRNRCVTCARTRRTHFALLFSEILSCQAEFKTAIENYLDPFMNYFVIGDIEAASQAVNLLAQAAKGRANFFILQNFRRKRIDRSNGLKAPSPASPSSM